MKICIRAEQLSWRPTMPEPRLPKRIRSSLQITRTYINSGNLKTNLVSRLTKAFNNLSIRFSFPGQAFKTNRTQISFRISMVQIRIREITLTQIQIGDIEISTDKQ